MLKWFKGLPILSKAYFVTLAALIPLHLYVGEWHDAFLYCVIGGLIFCYEDLNKLLEESHNSQLELCQTLYEATIQLAVLKAENFELAKENKTLKK